MVMVDPVSPYIIVSTRGSPRIISDKELNEKARREPPQESSRGSRVVVGERAAGEVRSL